MKTHIHMILGLLLLGLLTFSISACNTMHGLGRDTEVVGEKIQDEADQHIDENRTDDNDNDNVDIDVEDDNRQ